MSEFQENNQNALNDGSRLDSSGNIGSEVNRTKELPEANNITVAQKEQQTPKTKVKTSSAKVHSPRQDELLPGKVQKKEKNPSLMRTQSFKKQVTVTSEEKKVGTFSNCFDCIKSAAYCGFSDDQAQKDANKLLYRMICDHWCIIITQIPLGALGSIPELAAPLYIGKTIDAFQADDENEVTEVVKQWALIIVIGAVLGMIREILTHYASEVLGAELRQKFYESVIHKGVAFYDDKKTGDIMSRLQSDSEIVQTGLSTGIAFLMKSIGIFVGILVIIFSFSFKMSIVTICMMGPICILAPTSSKLFQFTAKKATKIRSEMSTVFHEAFSNIRTVKAFACEKEQFRTFQDKNDAVFAIGRTQAIYKAWMDGCWQWLFVGAFVGMLWYAVQLYKDPANNFTIGLLFTFLMYNWIVIGQVMTFGDTLSQVYRVKGSFYEMSKMIQEEETQVGYYQQKDVPKDESRQGNVEYRNVKFEYPTKPDVPILRNISVRVDDNQIVALVGTSGCGKTSMVSLLERFYDPSDGKIFYNGESITELDTEWYHKTQIAIVSQEPVLFSETIKNNILYGFDTSKYSEEEIKERLEFACKQAHCLTFLEDKEKFPDGLETEVGEKGVRLSGGQKQRVAIARALVRKPRVLLLDEATSALDAESEHEVQKALDELMATRNQTIIVIAHRLSTIACANKIVVLRHGVVVEEGSHKDLVAKDGVYKKLVQRQLINMQLGEEDQELVLKRNQSHMSHMSINSNDPRVKHASFRSER